MAMSCVMRASLVNLPVVVLVAVLLAVPAVRSDLLLKDKYNGKVVRVMRTNIPDLVAPAPPPAGGPRAAASRAGSANVVDLLPIPCPRTSDQIGNTCPTFPNLKSKVPPPGGPVGRNPVKKVRVFSRDQIRAAGLRERAAATAPRTTPPVTKKGRHLLQQTDSPAPTPNPVREWVLNQGSSWWVRNSNVGVAPIHMQLNRYNKAIMIDRKFNAKQYPNPTGIEALEFDVDTNTGRKLTLATNTWCSAGVALLGGKIISLGGGSDGIPGGDSVRLFDSCTNNRCDFTEDPGQRLLARRWYPGAVLMPDGRSLLISGSDYDYYTGDHGDSFEMWPRVNPLENNLANMQLPINWNLQANALYRHLYPHVHLLPDGNLFLLAGNKWYVGHLEAGNSNIVKGPGMLDPRWQDGGTPVTYPAEGNSFLLPLEPPYVDATVVVCGATWGWFDPNAFVDPDCAIIKASDPTPVSTRTRLKEPNKRIMPYCIYMLDGNVVCMGGSSQGSAGYYAANQPQQPVSLLNTKTLTFSTGPPAKVFRLYHSVATLVKSGAVMNAGTNAQGGYYFKSDPRYSIYPAEYRVEYYYPWYFSQYRPVILNWPSPAPLIAHGGTFTAVVRLAGLNNVRQGALVMPGFSTHNQQYSQRYVRLVTTCTAPAGECAGPWDCAATTVCTFRVPSNRAVAPPGDYMLTVLDNGVPSEARWIGIGP